MYMKVLLYVHERTYYILATPWSQIPCKKFLYAPTSFSVADFRLQKCQLYGGSQFLPLDDSNGGGGIEAANQVTMFS